MFATNENGVRVLKLPAETKKQKGEEELKPGPDLVQNKFKCAGF